MSDFLLREILVPVHLREEYLPDATACRLVNVSKLNVIIGPNNVGKSRLLRHLFHDVVKRRLVFSCGDEVSEELRSRIARLLRVAAAYSEDDGKQTARAVERVLKASFPPFRGWSERHVNMADDGSLKSLRNELQNSARFQQVVNEEVGDFQHFVGQMVQWHEALKAGKIESIPAQIPQVACYVPAIRTLRTPDNANNRTALLERTVDDYFGKDGELKRVDAIPELGLSPICTGELFYREVQRYRNGTEQQQEQLDAFQKFLGDSFYDGARVRLIPHQDDKFVHVKIGTEAQRPIYELGDGIQQIVIQTLPLFVHREHRLLLFIEEPELYLHPGFQHALIDAFIHHSGPMTQVFVATHSNQFMDITIDDNLCTVFKVRKAVKEEQGPPYRVDRRSDKDFALLRALGVRNSSVLLSNCTIWVEGVTDRKYLRHFVELHQKSLGEEAKHYLEDLHYSFVEYSGSNITHWSFLDREEGIDVQRVCGQLLLIADLDDENGPKKDRRERLKEVLQERCIILSRREIENVLSKDTLIKVLRHYEGQDVQTKQFDYPDYATAKLGEFIEQNILAAASKRRVKKKKDSEERNRPYVDSKGALKGKDEFCDLAIANMETLADLSAEARDLGKRIYEFVAAHNVDATTR